MSAINLQEVHDFLIEVAYKAGDMITSATPNAATSGQKKNSVDLVTETDKDVEATTVSTVGERSWDGFLYAIKL